MSNPSDDTSGTASGEATDSRAWADEFAVTPMQIEEAIKAVGARKADVEMYLKGSHSSTDSDIAKQGR